MNISPKSFIPKSSAEKTFILFAVLFFLLIVSLWAAVFFGSTNTSVFQAVKASLSGDFQDTAYRIIFHVRLPRVAAAVLAGSALAVSGIIIQAVLNNAMAAPNIIGVNAGAGFAAIILIAIFPAALHLLPFAAFFGAVAACLCIYAIAAKTGASRMTITLVGIAVSSILTAGINTVKTVFPDSILNANSFSVGGISGVAYSRLSPACYIIFIGLLLSFLLAKDIDVLNLGEETAKSLGMNVGAIRFFLLVLASALAGSAVSFAGLLGFVGLVVPHIMRRLVGANHRLLIPAGALGGSILVLLCDLAGRMLFAPYEVPVGIILSFVGGPFFIMLILTRKKGRMND